MEALEEATNWKHTAAAVLDVRQELAEGGEPFARIMTAATQIEPGQSLVIVAPFEPAPLYTALGSRGMSHATVCVAADEWIVRFSRDQ